MRVGEADTWTPSPGQPGGFFGSSSLSSYAFRSTGGSRVRSVRGGEADTWTPSPGQPGGFFGSSSLSSYAFCSTGGSRVSSVHDLVRLG